MTQQADAGHPEDSSSPEARSPWRGLRPGQGQQFQPGHAQQGLRQQQAQAQERQMD